jgi:four helix bundle protein
MFLPLEHKNADLFLSSKRLLYGCYELTGDITAVEKGFLAEQLRKAALLAHTNIVQGLFSKKGKKRMKHFKRAKNAWVIVDAGLEMILQLGWVTTLQLSETEKELQTCFDTISQMQKK